MAEAIPQGGLEGVVQLFAHDHPDILHGTSTSGLPAKLTSPKWSCSQLGRGASGVALHVTPCSGKMPGFVVKIYISTDGKYVSKDDGEWRRECEFSKLVSSLGGLPSTIVKFGDVTGIAMEEGGMSISWAMRKIHTPIQRGAKFKAQLNDNLDEICANVLWQLHTLHTNGLAHCDLKPENVFLYDVEQICYVGDFGSAVAFGKKDAYWISWEKDGQQVDAHAPIDQTYEFASFWTLLHGYINPKNGEKRACENDVVAFCVMVIEIIVDHHSFIPDALRMRPRDEREERWFPFEFLDTPAACEAKRRYETFAAWLILLPDLLKHIPDNPRADGVPVGEAFRLPMSMSEVKSLKAYCEKRAYPNGLRGYINSYFSKSRPISLMHAKICNILITTLEKYAKSGKMIFAFDLCNKFRDLSVQTPRDEPKHDQHGPYRNTRTDHVGAVASTRNPY